MTRQGTILVLTVCSVTVLPSVGGCAGGSAPLDPGKRGVTHRRHAGRGFFHILQQSRRMELTRYKQDGFVDNVQVLTAGDASCEACRRLEGRIFTLDEALEQMPIPSEDCTFDFQGTGQPGWCRCLYSAVFD